MTGVRDMRGTAKATVETFEGRHEPNVTKLRLSLEDQRLIAYVLSGWASEVGCGSNFGSMIATLIANEPPDTHRRKMRTTPDGGSGSRGEHNQTACPHAQIVSFDASEMTSIERWCNERRLHQDKRGHVGGSYELREKRLRCWRALRDLNATRPFHAVVIHALYGDLPPGLPSEGLFSEKDKRGIDLDYRRVCRYAPSAGGSGTNLESMVSFEHRRRHGESDASFKERESLAIVVRTEKLVAVGRECERLITAASGAYKAAWRSA
jgi:hypothetical protein